MRALHDARWAADLWQRLVDAVEQPVRVAGVEGRRRVQVLGILRLEEDPEGRLRASAWRLCGRQPLNGRPPVFAWRPLDADGVLLRPFLSGWEWLGWIEHASSIEWARRWAVEGQAVDVLQVQVYMASLFRHFRGQLTRRVNLRSWRAALQAALPLDPLLLRICHRFIRPGQARAPSLSDYRFAQAHRAALEQLEREHPQMVAPYALACGQADFPTRDQPMQALHQFLRKRGVPPRVWRLLLASGPRLLLPLRHFYSGHGLVALIDLLRILALLNARTEPPRWFVWCALSKVANPAYRFNQHLSEIVDCADQWSVALRHLLRIADAKRNRNDVADVISWLFHEKPRLDDRQRRAGWAWLVRSAKEWRERERAVVERRGLVWPLPEWRRDATPPAADRHGLVVVPITDGLALWEEGQAMRHCIADRTPDCLTGHALVFSVRETADPQRRVATALLKVVAGRWQLTGVRRFANQDPPPHVVRLMRAHAGALQPPSERSSRLVVEPRAPSLAPPAPDRDTISPRVPLRLGGQPRIRCVLQVTDARFSLPHCGASRAPGCGPA